MVAKQVFVPFALSQVLGAPALALGGVFGLTLGYPASAQNLPVVGIERIEGAEPSVAVIFEGLVNDPKGMPAEGAVVVSSAGGKAVTDESGSFRLEARVPLEAADVQITAVGDGGGNLLAGVSVALPAGMGPVQVGVLELASSTGCSPAWLPTFGPEPGMNDGVAALVVYDDGGGPALYAAGPFTTAAGVVAKGIARWDGSSWTPVGSGLNGNVHALTVYDDGGGPALYAGGSFQSAGSVPVSRIAKWDGSSWTALGSGVGGGSAYGPIIYALTVYDDGDGAALYAGGDFATAGGVAANNIAQWDGSSWTALGSGTNDWVYALAVYDDGDGAALYAGGTFSSAGGIPSLNLAKWDGSSWSPEPGGLNGGSASVKALMVYDDGSGSALYAGGNFYYAGFKLVNKIAKWDGSSWAALGSGIFGSVSALAVYDDGGGPALYVGGGFTSAGGLATNGIAKWDGSTWTALGSGVPGVSALTVYDDGGGPALYAGGGFTYAGGVAANRVAKWDGSSWAALGSETFSGVTDTVHALAVYDDGDGSDLYAGGDFFMAGDVMVNFIAKWDGSSWTELGNGMSSQVFALVVHDDGGGPALYAGGWFYEAGGVPVGYIARWDGSSWTALGSGMNARVKALTVFDDGSGPALYAGGDFSSAGGVLAMHVAKWDGSSWMALGSGTFVGNGTNDDVEALTVHDDGDGPALYVGGVFTIAGGGSSRRIAKWDGSSWSELDTGMNDGVYALTTYDDGGGMALYAGGAFTSAGGVAANYIAKWNGSSWTPLGSGFGPLYYSSVEVLAVHDDGGGPALYAGGEFTNAGGVAANNIAKWDGSSWKPLGSGVNSTVYTLAEYDDGGGPALFAGGSFSIALDSGDSYLAKWGCESPPPTTYCTAGTSASGCQALLSATGTPSTSMPSGFSLQASSVEGAKDGMFFWGKSGKQATPWGNSTSFQCVVPPVTRGGALLGVGTNGACDGSFAQDLNATWCSTCPYPQKNPGAGATVQAQLWYRDPASTSNQTTSLSDAVEFGVGL